MTNTRRIHTSIALVAGLALAASGCSKTEDKGDNKDPSAATTGQASELGPAAAVGGLSVKAPKSWQSSQPKSQMRVAQWSIGDGDKAAELVAYYFGARGAGMVQANLDRWYGQFQQADGKPSKDAAKVAEMTVGGMKVTRVEVGGTYVAEVRPGAAEKHNKADYHMLAAIIEAKDGPYYFKMVGPSATVKAATADFDAMIKAIEPGTGAAPAADADAEKKKQEQIARLAKMRKDDQEKAKKELERWTDDLRKKATDLVETKHKDVKAALTAIVASEHRVPGHSDRDAHRHPVETLTFFGIKPDMTVIETGAGRGWYSEIVAPLVAKSGKLIIATYKPEGPEDSFLPIIGQRVVDFIAKSPEIYATTSPVFLDPSASIELGAEGSADLVLTFREMHNWHRNKILDTYVAAVFKVLKPGGTFGVVQHRAKADANPDESAQKGYLPEKWLIEAVEKAGFKLAEKSEVNANPKDTKDYEGGVWTLPPNLRGDESKRDEYVAIGESDRMTLKFVKPAK